MKRMMSGAYETMGLSMFFEQRISAGRVGTCLTWQPL